MPSRQEQTGYPCPQCRQSRLFVRTINEANHLAHGLVTLFLCGLWFPIWLMAILSQSVSDWRCTQCGFAYERFPPIVPQRQQRPQALAEANGRKRCSACGREALAVTECGETVYTCAACGRLG